MVPAPALVNNPFDQLLDPSVAQRAAAASTALSALQRKVHRPMGAGDAEVGEDAVDQAAHEAVAPAISGRVAALVAAAKLAGSELPARVVRKTRSDAPAYAASEYLGFAFKDDQR